MGNRKNSCKTKLIIEEGVMAKQVLVVMPMNERQRAYLEKQASSGCFDCTFKYMKSREVTAEDLDGVSALIGNLSPEIIEKSGKRLEWVQLNSAGADMYVTPGVLSDSTVLTNAAGAYGLSVSEHMLALTFDLIRKFEIYHHNQEHHIWKDEGNIASVEGATVLVMGLGDIGGAYARKMKALGAACVIGIRRTDRDRPSYVDEQYTMDRLDEVIGRADIVAMVLPGEPETRHIMNEDRLRAMKKGAYLINVGRGSAIDPDALKHVLTDGHLGGAGLDVTEPEPLPADDLLWTLPNVIITPHVAGQFNLPETIERIVRMTGENMNAWACGRKLKHIVNRKTGY